jgi:Flp pilus assembly protein TadB
MNSMLSPLSLSFLAGVATLLIAVGLMRPTEGLISKQSRTSWIARLDIRLKRAGLISASPAAVLSGLTLSMGLVFAVLFVAFNSLPLSIFAVVVMPFLLALDLDRRARKYQDKVTARLVPFLRNITAQIRTGQNPTRAFALAASDDPLLAWALRSQLANLQMQQPFQDVLRDSLHVMPLRPWVQFVRSMENFARSGGSALAEVLENNVTRIQSQVLLRQRLMGDVATYRGQQIVILGFAFAIPGGLYLMAPTLFGSLFSSVLGYACIAIMLSLDGLAFWMTSRAIKDVESKMEA